MAGRGFPWIAVAAIIGVSVGSAFPPFLSVWGQKLPDPAGAALSVRMRRPIPQDLYQGRVGNNPARPRLPNGNPVFFNPAIYASGGVYAYSVATGDFNGDGKADLAVANQCPQSNCNAGNVSVLLGNGDGTFQAAQSYASGGYEAFSVAVGDVNGDGRADLIVANGCQSATQCSSGVVGVLLGRGDGTFYAAQSFSSGGLVASSVAIADLNKDGHADLAVTNQCVDGGCASGSVSVLLGNGNGTFQPAHTYPSAGLTAVSVAVGDFNGDQKMDLVVANQCQSAGDCSGNVGIFLGNGKGAFQAAQTYSSGGYETASVVVNDVNGDRIADLVVASQCRSSGNCTNGTVGVLLGKGDGSFQAPQNAVSGGNNTAAVVAGDLNGDGRSDLVLANECQAASNCNGGSISVLLGNGDGTFQPAQNYASDGVFAFAVNAGDWNGDGKPDVVAVNQCQTSSMCGGTVTVMLGNGDGTLQVPPSYASGGYDADSAAAADLNGDGKLDLVVANLCQSNTCSKGNSGSVSVLLGNGDGTFQAAQRYATGGFGSSSIAIGDLDSNGTADVVVANQCAASDCKSGGSVSILMGYGKGKLRAAQTYSSGANTALSVAIADFDKDGHPDLAIASQCQNGNCQSGAVSVLLGNGDGTFRAAQIYASGGYQTDSVTVADFNGDGNPDLAIASQCQDSSCQNGGVSVLLGNGDGTFQTAQSYDSAGTQADFVAVTDLNGDGIADLVVSNLCQHGDCSTGAVSSLLGKGDGTFRAAHAFSSGAQNAYSLAAKDFNGDGSTDVVVTNGDSSEILLGNGDGTFQQAVLYFPGGVFISAADFNGDHQPDVAIANGSLSTVTILKNIAVGFRQATTNTLTSLPNPSSVNQPVLFTATVTTQFGGPPTGTVTFKSGSATLGQAPLSNGQATLNYSFTSPGQSPIVAAYSGDSGFLPSNSPPLKQKVIKAPTTTTLTSSPNPSQVGQSVQFTATVTGQYGGTPTGSILLRDNGT